MGWKRPWTDMLKYAMLMKMILFTAVDIEKAGTFLPFSREDTTDTRWHPRISDKPSLRTFLRHTDEHTAWQFLVPISSASDFGFPYWHSLFQYTDRISTFNEPSAFKIQ